MTTPKEFKQAMKEIYPEDGCYDEEISHGCADDLLCVVLRELGYGEGIDIFDKGDKWYA